MIRNVAQELINACFDESSNDRVRMEGFGGGDSGGRNGVNNSVSADGRSGVGARAGARPRAQPLCPREGALAAEREPSDLHPSGQAVVARRDLVR